MSSLRLPGPPAFSSFRREKLLASVRQIRADITGVQAYYEHFVDLDAELSAAELLTLQELLRYGPAWSALDLSGSEILVVPRIGTISPWSSKATDIARNCGLEKILRIERGIRFTFAATAPLNSVEIEAISALVHDRMTETWYLDDANTDFDTEKMFAHHAPAPLAFIPVNEQGHAALAAANTQLGLALSADEIDYLVKIFTTEGRDPTDAELMMFSQANSEHCRHKIFNADWVIDGESQPHSLFDMIRLTHAAAPDGVLSAYKDNSAVIAGGPGQRLLVNSSDGHYRYQEEDIHILMKVETHNHPTAISPFPGAATGSGGEIRDEGATGRGARPKAGLTGFSVSHLRIPDFEQPWETTIGKPERIASAREIMLEGPIGGAAFNNEFGRPNIAGYFRTFEQSDASGNTAIGYHKPIMIAGGLGNIRPTDVEKPDVPSNALVVVLGGPAMLIGLGGGAASSVGSGASHAELDFASVQRGNPEMQRRAQQVIDACWSLGAQPGGHNPIVIVHDVGAGGLSNAVPEVVDHSGLGAVIDLRAVPSAESGMSPLEIWCNEAQERYVLALLPDDLDTFVALCERERCPYAVIGQMNDTGRLVVQDAHSSAQPVDMELQSLLGKPPQTVKDIATNARAIPPNELTGIDLDDACRRVLRFPTVADKSFLIHIGDRTVGGLVAQDQLVGPWQVPVSDVGVTLRSFTSTAGEALAMGERTPVAVLNPAASGRLAVGEAVTNLAAARIEKLSDIRLSANWMAACGLPAEDQALFETVTAVGRDICRELGIAIPVGKDSLSMQTRWQDGATEKVVHAPLSLIVSGFAPVLDVRKTLTPQLQPDPASKLYLIDLGAGKNRLGASCLSQVMDLPGGAPPDLNSADQLRGLFQFVQAANAAGLILAYHDRSDGGLFVSLAEMMFAGRIGIDVRLAAADQDTLLAQLFSEELGAVLQVATSATADFAALLDQHELAAVTIEVGSLNDADRLVIHRADEVVFTATRTDLHRTWSEVSFRMQAERDNPDTAQQQYAALLDVNDPGLSPRLGFDSADDVSAPYLNLGARPRVAVLREQGVNSQNEMAAAFHRAGFAPVDVHMTDLLSNRVVLAEFVGAVACGGFSFGDVLGAGGGWAKSILFNAQLRDQFATFFARPDSFALGVCNGCQMLADLQELIPGSEHWPRFVTNQSEQFEARLSLVEVLESPSIFFQGMQGSLIPIAVSHGEGCAEFAGAADQETVFKQQHVALRYVNNYGEPTLDYPANPNGSPGGIAGLCSADGRVTISMPHPERVHLAAQYSWCPADWSNAGPWMRMFRNARVWVD